VIDSYSYALQMADALNNLGEHTFRDGKVVAKISGFSCKSSSLTIDYVDATYDNIPIQIDTPLHIVDLVHDSDPLTAAHDAVAGIVRVFAGDS